MPISRKSFTRLALAGVFCLTPVFVRANITQDVPEGDIPTLVNQLGDFDFRLRAQAMEKLQAIGQPALPELEKASRDPDPERSQRAAQLIRRILQHPVPGSPFDPSGQINGSSLDVKIMDGVKTVTVDEGNRHVKIVEDAAGIHVEVKATVEEKELVENYSARTLAELKQDCPEAGQIYDRWGGGEGLTFKLGSIHLNGGTHHAPKPILRRQSDRHIVAMRKELNEQMDAKNVAPEKRAQINALLDMMMDTLNVENNVPQEVDLPGGNSALSDMLREALRDTGVAEPQGLPKSAPGRIPNAGGNPLGRQLLLGRLRGDPVDNKPKLGVQLQPADNGIVVTNVIPNTRAEKLGILPGDRIIKVQGEQINTAGDLARVIGATGQPLTVIVDRDGKALTFEEKQADFAEAMKPPPQKLGVSALPNDMGGVNVVEVGPDSRGEKLGLKVGDRIFKIQGQDVQNAAQILKIVTSSRDLLTIEGEREGKPMTLQEKAEAKPEEKKPDEEKKPEDVPGKINHLARQ